MPDENWKRLGRLLVQRRVQLGYAKRMPWARDVLGLKNDRIQSDLENGRRENYDAATLALAEHQYRVAAGSIDDVLAGGELTPLPDPDLYILPSGLRPATPVNLDGADLSSLYGMVVVFTEAVRKLDASLSERAVTLMFQAARLYADALRLLEGGDGHAEEPRGSAPTNADYTLAAADDEVDPRDEAEQAEESP